MRWKKEWEDPAHYLSYEDLDDEISKIGARLSYLGSALARAEREVSRFEDTVIPVFKQVYREKYINKEDPITGRKYSKTGIDEKRQLDPAYIRIKKEYRKIVERRDLLKNQFTILLKRESMLESLCRYKTAMMLKDQKNSI